MTIKYEHKELISVIGNTQSITPVVIVYDTDAPNIQGIGRTECEALQDLLDKYKAIFDTIGKLQKKQCED